MTPPSNPITFTDFITKREVLQIVKGLVQYYDGKISELSLKLNESLSKKQNEMNCCINGPDQ